MYYVIQENVFRDSHYNFLLSEINRLGLEYETVRLHNGPPFEIKTTRKDVFCFGSIKLARLAKENAWFPGSLMNSYHDYKVYSTYWKENMLNWDSQVQLLEEKINFNSERKFIRPTKDSKIFNGNVYTQKDWSTIYEKLQYRKDWKSEMIQVANPKKIYQEIRCWIIDKKVISASTYKQGEEIRYWEYKDKEGLDFAAKMAKQYQPADAFVLDICLIENAWKIVEVNCINSAGFYACNLQKIIIELENFYDKR